MAFRALSDEEPEEGGVPESGDLGPEQLESGSEEGVEEGLE